ncbi:MAG: FkbM family methyltransferase [Deltaproteobacteria bacterium]|nr:FkbM family methyltransferase [Deltaproteobacteria bacterium]
MLKIIYPIKQPHSSLRTVINYDQGLINVDTSSLAEYKILFFRHCEPALCNLIKNIVKPGDLCLDIGANVGAITLVMSFATGPKGKVIALEPHPGMVERLKANVELNRVDNVSIMPVALSDSAGRSILYTPEEDQINQGRSSLKPSQGINREITVEKITGEMLQDEIGNRLCKFIKIDVEGHDFIVLKELAFIIERKEHHCDIQEAVEFIISFDYRIYFVKHDLVFPFERAVPDSCDIFCSPKILLL